MAITMKNCKVEFSTGGTSWTDVSSDANAVMVDGFELDTDNQPVFNQAKRIQTAGGFAIGTVKVRALYAESTSGAWGMAQSAHDNRTPLYIRWSPQGGSTGNYHYTTDAGYVKNAVWPAGEADAKMLMPEITLETPWVTQSTI